ncbi:Uncharacterised protein [Legionella pneumophila]|nr:Uncharacterised protein [Legionella pneumophila]
MDNPFPRSAGVGVEGFFTIDGRVGTDDFFAVSSWIGAGVLFVTSAGEDLWIGKNPTWPATKAVCFFRTGALITPER